MYEARYMPIMDTQPLVKRHSHHPKRARTICGVVVMPEPDERQECGRIVAKGCDNQVCKPHCESMGNCHLHSAHAGLLTMAVAGGRAERERDGMGGMHNILDMYNNQYEHVRPQDVILPMPPLTSAELHAHEQRELNTALALSLQPCPNQPFVFPNVSGSGSASSSIMSGSGSSLSNISTLASSLASTSRFDTAYALTPPTPGSQLMETNMFFTDLYHSASMSNAQSTSISTHHQAHQTTETSGDQAVGRTRDVQSTSNKHPIATIDARLSHQMHGAWLNEFEAREESQAKRLRDQAQQAALGRRCQRQFLLKFFSAVRDRNLGPSILAHSLGKTNEEVLVQLIQDIDDADWPSYPLANHLPDLLGVQFEEVELLDISTRTWFCIRKGHAIPLTNNLHVFAWRLGVKCQDFDYHYNLFVKPPRTTNIRTNMRGE
jgi:hypothetical protein